MLGVKAKLKIDDLVLHKNIAEELDDDVLSRIASEVIRGYDIDEDSRAEWISQNEEAMKVAKQVMEKKTFPWPNSANVKYPLIAQSSLQFASRAYPELVKGSKVVQGKVTGADPDGIKKERADRISDHMSYQLIEQMTEWEEEFDKLLHALPVLGCMFRKTFWDPALQRNRSDLCLPADVVVNHDTSRDMDSCRRITHKINLYKNEVIERERMGIFIVGASEDIDPETGEDKPHEFLEQHCWIDLDGDEYDEPYVVTVNKSNQKVFRIVARFDAKSVHVIADGKNKGLVERIEPIQYFTKYSFIPDFEGKFYDYGFGRLLFAINESVNTVINELLDAGALSNLQSGFVSKQFGRAKNDSIRLEAGEFKVLDLAAHEMRDGIMPMPAREPSSALFQLLGVLLEAGKELASSSELLSGQQNRSNVPATTTLALIEQGLKVFNSIFKRLYRSMTSEFKKIFVLNKNYLEDQEYFTVLDEVQLVAREDYSTEDLDVRPVADPNMSTDVQQLFRAEALLNTMQMPGVDPWEVTHYYLKALKVPDEDLEKLHPPKPEEPEQPPPDPKMMELQAKMQMEQQKLPVEMEQMQAETQKIQVEIAKLQSEIELNNARIEEIRGKEGIERYRSEMDLAKHLVDNKSRESMVTSNNQSRERVSREGLNHRNGELAAQNINEEDQQSLEMEQELLSNISDEQRATGGMAGSFDDQGANEAAVEAEERPVEPVSPEGNI